MIGIRQIIHDVHESRIQCFYRPTPPMCNFHVSIDIDIDLLKLLLEIFEKNKKIYGFEMTNNYNNWTVFIFLNYNSNDENFQKIEINFNKAQEIISDIDNVEELEFPEPYKLDNDLYKNNKEIYDELLNFFNLQKEQLFNDFS